MGKYLRYEVFKVNYKIIIHCKAFYKILTFFHCYFDMRKSCNTKYGHFLTNIINVLQAFSYSLL